MEIQFKKKYEKLRIKFTKNKKMGVKFIKRIKKMRDKKCNYVRSKLKKIKIYKFIKIKNKTHQINLLKIS